MEDYPPRGFIVGGHFVSPEGANIFPSLYAPSRAAPFACGAIFIFCYSKKGFVE